MKFKVIIIVLCLLVSIAVLNVFPSVDSHTTKATSCEECHEQIDPISEQTEPTCYTCHDSPAAITVDTRYVKIKPNQVFHIEVTASFFGEAVAWMIKWPESVADNRYFIFTPARTEVYEAAGTQTETFAISASDSGIYTIRVYVAGDAVSRPYERHQDITVTIEEAIATPKAPLTNIVYDYTFYGIAILATIEVAAIGGIFIIRHIRKKKTEK